MADMEKTPCEELTGLGEVLVEAANNLDLGSFTQSLSTEQRKLLLQLANSQNINPNSDMVAASNMTEPISEETKKVCEEERIQNLDFTKTIDFSDISYALAAAELNINVLENGKQVPLKNVVKREIKKVAAKFAAHNNQEALVGEFVYKDGRTIGVYCYTIKDVLSHDEIVDLRLEAYERTKEDVFPLKIIVIKNSIPKP